MTIDNTLLMTEAREALRGKWGIAAGGSFIYILIMILAGGSDKFSQALSAIIGGPMYLGISVFSLALARRQEAKISQLFVGFNEFLRTLVAYLLMGVFILLWCLLFIIPGIIMALAYSQTFYILAEDKNIKVRAAIEKSRAMMDGYKEELFILGLRFIGWFLLSILTLGIGLPWFLAYFQTTMALFYDKVSKREDKPAEALPA